jgi:Mg2+ and Co2+ transporter CorA
MVKSGMVKTPKAAVDLINTDTIDLNELVKIMSQPPAPEISTTEDEESTEADEVQRMRQNGAKAQRISAVREEVFRLQRQLGEELKRFNATR